MTPTSSSSKSPSTVRLSKLKPSRPGGLSTAGSKPSSADNSDDELGFGGGDDDDDIFNAAPVGSGSGAEQWTTTGPKVFFNSLKVEHVIAVLEELKEGEGEVKTPTTERSSKSSSEKSKGSKDGAKKPPIAPKNSTTSNIIQVPFLFLDESFT